MRYNECVHKELQKWKGFKSEFNIIQCSWRQHGNCYTKAFYYNQKIIGFHIKRSIYLGNESIDFDNASTRGLLDWGRGVWTYHNTWYWGAGAGKVGDKEIGFNIGYGFWDTSNASENMVFVNGKAHKLDQVKFNIPVKDGICLWINGHLVVTTDDLKWILFLCWIGIRVQMLNWLVLFNIGRFSRKMILDNGKRWQLRSLWDLRER